MRSIDADALKKVILNLPNDNPSYYYTGDLLDRERVLDEIDNAPTVEPRIEYGADGQPYRLFMSGGQVVPDMLQGWRYEERPHGEWITSKIDGEKYNCSECGGSCWYYDYQGNVSKSNFCPNCGADMRGKE